jgi:hypothetical protein
MIHVAVVAIYILWCRWALIVSEHQRRVHLSASYDFLNSSRASKDAAALHVSQYELQTNRSPVAFRTLFFVHFYALPFTRFAPNGNIFTAALSAPRAPDLLMNFY